VIDLSSPATLGDLRELEATLAGRAPAPPPPHDLRAEECIVAELLEGGVRLEVVACLEATDFFSPLLAAIFAVVTSVMEAGVEPRPDVIVRALEGLGYGSRIAAEVERIRDTTPAPVRLPEVVARVALLARRRRALAALLRAEAGLRADATEDEIIDAMRAAARELRT